MLNNKTFPGEWLDSIECGGANLMARFWLLSEGWRYFMSNMNGHSG